jgi:DNA-binding protein HU-beta
LGFCRVRPDHLDGFDRAAQNCAETGAAVTKQELIKRVATKVGLPNRKQVGALVDAVFGELGEYFIEARTSFRGRATARFSYPGFGTFTKKKRGPRPGRNPQTGEPITIPATTTVAFQPGSELKEKLNRDLPRKRRVGG